MDLLNPVPAPRCRPLSQVSVTSRPVPLIEAREGLR
jgi:hypothetical protein